MQKAMNQKMEKQEYKYEYAKRTSVEGPFGILKEQFQIEKEIVIGNDKNRRKNKSRCTSIQSNQITQHKTRNKKHNRRLRRFLRKHIHKKTNYNSQQQYSKKKITQPQKSHFWRTPLKEKKQPLDKKISRGLKKKRPRFL